MDESGRQNPSEGPSGITGLTETPPSLKVTWPSPIKAQGLPFSFSKASSVYLPRASGRVLECLSPPPGLGHDSSLLMVLWRQQSTHHSDCPLSRSVCSALGGGARTCVDVPQDPGKEISPCAA